MTGFSVLPDPLFQTGNQYDYVREQLANIFTNFGNSLAATGDFIGHDQYGQAFAAKYWPTVFTLLDQMDMTHLGLSTIRDALQAIAGNYQQGDQAVQQSTPSTG